MTATCYEAIITWSDGSTERHSLKGKTENAALKSALYLSMRLAAKRGERARRVEIRLRDGGCR